MAIVREGTADLGNNGGSGNLTVSYTVSSISNLLVVSVNGSLPGTGDNISGVTYNGAAMTKAGSVIVGNSDRNNYFFYLFNPAVGSNNIVVSDNGLGTSPYALAVAADYSGVDTATIDDVLTYTSTTTSFFDCHAFVNNEPAWVIMSSMTSLASPMTSSSLTQAIFGGQFDQPSIWDSDGTVTSVGSYAQNCSSSLGIGCVVCVFQELTLPGAMQM